HRLQQQIDATGDATLLALHAELAGYPAPGDEDAPEPDAVVVPMRMRSEVGELSFLSTTTVFGTPVAVTLSELAIESFFPADAQTSELLRTTGFVRAMEDSPPPGREAP